ncbi:DUF5713 family protein [Paenibacillus alvei]
MLKSFVWKKNDIHSIQLKENVYIIAQLLESPYVAFFNITSERNHFDEKPLDLNTFKPFGVCMVLKGFFKQCSVGKLKNVQPNLNIPIPEIFISSDRGQWGNRSEFSDIELIYNLVRIDPTVGDKGLMGNEIIQYNIDRNDPNMLNNYEIVGYNTGYEFVRRLILSIENGRWIDPLKEQRLLGIDNYPLQTVEEMWQAGVPKYGVEDKDGNRQNENEAAQISYLIEMYNDPFYPEFLVDKVKECILRVVPFIEKGNRDVNKIQSKLDEMTIAINDLADEFGQNNSELETVARESNAATVESVLQYHKIDIVIEDALREREW